MKDIEILSVATRALNDAAVVVLRVEQNLVGATKFGQFILVSLRAGTESAFVVADIILV